MLEEHENSPAPPADGAGSAGSSDAGKVDWDFVGRQEGSSLRGYTVKGPDGRPMQGSGVTVGIGIDLGARGRCDIEAFGLSRELTAKLAPYLGLKGDSAERELASAPLILTREEADRLSGAAMAGVLSRLRRNYGLAVGNHAAAFDALPGEAQTAIADVAFQWGPDFGKRDDKFARHFWQAATSRDWPAAEAVLREWAVQTYHGQAYRNRRNAEADLLAKLGSAGSARARAENSEGS